MLHVLLVSTSEKTTGILKEYLNMEDCMNITACKTASRARRTALETAFDMIIINYPLADEREYELPQDLAEKVMPLSCLWYRLRSMISLRIAWKKPVFMCC
ncbi:MAG: hypothetical protein ACLRL6_15910 [Clostridium sp.]